MMVNKNKRKLITILFTIIFVASFVGCNQQKIKNRITVVPMIEKQITFLPKNHDLDNNDNFSLIEILQK